MNLLLQNKFMHMDSSVTSSSIHVEICIKETAYLICLFFSASSDHIHAFEYQIIESVILTIGNRSIEFIVSILTGN